MHRVKEKVMKYIFLPSRIDLCTINNSAISPNESVVSQRFILKDHI